MKKIIVDLIRGVVKKDIDFEVTAPPDEKMGHYSVNVAFALAKIEKKDPFVVAGELSAELMKAGREIFVKVEAAKPGFINFWLKPELFHQELAEILKNKNNYGKRTLRQAQGKKIQVEFVSANPTGPLTLANGRGGFLGDVLANILKFYGYKVEREFYVNDTGNQILTFGKSILAAAGLIPVEEEFYKGDYVKEWAEVNPAAVKKNTNNPLKLGQLAAGDFIKKIKAVLGKKAGIEFDRYTSEEKHVHRRKLTLKALDVFKKAGKVYEKDGAVWLKTTDFGDDKDRVLITGDSQPTYFLADAGHYLETVKRGFGAKINILGPDHYGYVKRIQAAAQLVGLKKSEVIVTQAIRLMSGGQEFKMSKRKGVFVPFEELMEQVGLDAARFFMLMTAPETHLDFDLDLAREKSMKNPVFYVQYAYVRARNIIQRANFKFKIENLKLLNTEADLNLIRRLIEFPEIVENIAVNYQVHRLTRYATELARAFHNFYEKERVIGEAGDLANARLALVKAVQTVLGTALTLLGINRPDKM